MKRIYPFVLISNILLILFGEVAISQCRVLINTTDEGYTFYLPEEDILIEYEDLLNQSNLITFQTLLIHPIKINDKIQVGLFVFSKKKDRKTIIVPGKLKILFTDNSQLNIDAETISSPVLDSGNYVVKCFFRMEPDNFYAIIEKTIKEVQIQNNRDGTHVISRNNNEFLFKQVICIMAEWMSNE